MPPCKELLPYLYSKEMGKPCQQAVRLAHIPVLSPGIPNPCAHAGMSILVADPTHYTHYTFSQSPSHLRIGDVEVKGCLFDDRFCDAQVFLLAC